MKKYLYFLMMVMCLGFVSCGSDSDNDDEGGSNSGNSSNPLVATWVYTNKDNWGYEKYVYVFNNNGTGYSLYEYSDNSTGTTETGRDRVDFTYKVISYNASTGVGVAQTIHSSGESFTVSFSISGKTLVWDKMTFTRQ